jgi:putative sterol carrier protein
MASVEECRTAIEELAERMAGADEEVRSHATLNRSLSCRITDLDVTFSGQLRDGHIHDITTEPAQRAQIRLTVSSDDLIALVDGHLHFASAWAKGRIKVEASIMDLLRLRSLL